MLPLTEAAVAPCSPWTPFEGAYRACLSVERLRRFRKDRDKQEWAPAIGRYLFNNELASALYSALNWAEVALRNHLHTIISDAYPLGGGRAFHRVESWLDANPPILLPYEQEKVAQAIADFDRRNTLPRSMARSRAPAKMLTDGRLVAELRFGFWARLLDGVYADWRRGPQFWPRLLDRAFPHCPPLQRTRKDIHTRFTQIKELRNRVFHHERISHQATLEVYDEILEAVHWIDTTIADALRDRDRPRFKAVLDSGPQPLVEWVAGMVTVYR